MILNIYQGRNDLLIYKLSSDEIHCSLIYTLTEEYAFISMTVIIFPFVLKDQFSNYQYFARLTLYICIYACVYVCELVFVRVCLCNI